jgi:hypothetical protein
LVLPIVAQMPSMVIVFAMVRRAERMASSWAGKI